jgi:hypothetical protein
MTQKQIRSRNPNFSYSYSVANVINQIVQEEQTENKKDKDGKIAKNSTHRLISSLNKLDSMWQDESNPEILIKTNQTIEESKFSDNYSDFLNQSETQKTTGRKSYRPQIANFQITKQKEYIESSTPRYLSKIKPQISNLNNLSRNKQTICDGNYSYTVQIVKPKGRNLIKKPKKKLISGTKLPLKSKPRVHIPSSDSQKMIPSKSQTLISHPTNEELLKMILKETSHKNK